MRKIKWTSILTAFLFLSGCATAKFDAEKTHAVKKLAILAIEIQQQQPKDALGIKKMSEFKTRIGDSPELQGMAKEIFADLTAQLERQTDWKVIGFKDMQSNPMYAEKVRGMMSGFRTTSLTSTGYEIVALKGELDAAAFHKLSQEERAKLAHSLGADAFATVQIIMQIDQGWSLGNISGDAPFSFQARSNLEVYNLASDAPIWRIQNVEGDKTERSDTLDASLPVRARIAKLGQRAAATSIVKMVDSYK